MKVYKEQKRIDEINVRLAEIAAAHLEYSSLLSERYKLEDAVRKKKKEDEYDRITLKTQYDDPVYPDIEVMSYPGSAVFETEQDVKDLIAALTGWYGYGRGYTFDWSGPGEYTVEPDYEYDHDGQMIYLAHFKRKNDE